MNKTRILFIITILFVVFNINMPAQSPTHFTFISNTGENASVIVPSSANPNIAGIPLSNDDEIGAFTPSGMCVGSMVWKNNNSAFTIWGDNAQTQAIDGIRAGEKISFRVWQKSTNTEFLFVNVVFQSGNSNYSANGIYVISTFSALDNPPAQPVLDLPINGTTSHPINCILSWNPINNASSYRLQIATDITFNNLIFDDSTIVSNSQSIGSLSNNQIYYWRVFAKNSGGSSAASTSWSFTTIINIPSSPTLLTPVDKATNQMLDLSLKWNASANSEKYHVQLSTDSLFNNIIVNDSTITGLSKTVGTLIRNKTYYWRVLSNNVAGKSSWSQVRSFLTIPLVPNGPELLTPTDKELNITISPSLSWSGVVGATSFRLQVSNDSLFKPVTFDDSTLTGTTKVVGPLQNNTRYYWRVLAINQGGSSEWSIKRSFTTIMPSLEKPDLLSPANSVKNIPLNSLFAWNSVSNSTSYRLQMSTDSSFGTVILDDSLLTSNSRSVSLSLNNQIYYWRVRAKNEVVFGSWSDRWSFTTIVSAPNVPILAQPNDNSINQQLNLNLNWNAVSGAEKYHLQVATDQQFNNLIINDSILTTLSKLIGQLNRNTFYYWRLSASNQGGKSAWSTQRSFTTIPFPPNPPELLLPADQAINTSTTPALSWSPIAGVTNYRLQVANDSGFSALISDDSAITVTTKTIGPLSYNTIFYWRVLAVNAGGTSVWSIRRSFTTSMQILSKPTLLSPANMLINAPTNLSLRWSNIGGATSYHLQVSKDSAFKEQIIDSLALNVVSYDLNNLNKSQVYYWRVMANSASGKSEWSVIWNFVTIPETPLSPTLLSPGNFMVDVSFEPIMNWSSVNGITNYRLQVSIDSFFNIIIVDDSTLQVSSKKLSQLSGSTIYYWRVLASNAGGSGMWSEVWRFTTKSGVPVTPSLLTPEDKKKDLPVDVNLSWSSSPGANNYRIQLSTDSNFTKIIIDDTNNVNTSRSIGPLLNNSVYYWKVSAKNNYGYSGWSVVRSFATIIPIPFPPVIISPLDNSANQPTVVKLQWNYDNNASFYILQVSLNSQFDSLIMNDTNVTETTKTLENLSVGTKYFWRVRASNIAGRSVWSIAQNFTTYEIILSSPVLIIPQDQTRNISVTPIFSWNYDSNATSYKLQVATDSAFSLIVVNDSNITSNYIQISNLEYGEYYYWRVVAINKNIISPWSEKWKFQTSIITLPIPTLLLPLNGELNQPIGVALKWNIDTNANYYHLQVSQDSFFVLLIVEDSLISSDSKTIGPLNNNNFYYWRLKSRNNFGSSMWSQLRSFKTIIGSPQSPILTAPPDNIGMLDTTLSLSWNFDSTVSFYHLQLSTDPSFQINFIDDTAIVNNNKIVYGLKNDARYYWHVSARNGGGNSPWSYRWIFTTKTGTPELNYPLNGSVEQQTSLLFQWSKDSNNVLYYLMIAEDSAFTKILFGDSSITENNKMVSGLKYLTKYYWKVSKKAYESSSEWSEIWYITTIGAPLLSPVLNTPNDKSVDQPTSLILNWNAISNATGYILHIALDSLFIQMVIEDTSLLSNTRQVVSLNNSMLYYWRVRARNSVGYSNWSQMFQFSTAETSPLSPMLRAPINGSINKSLTPELSWFISPSATSYWLQVSIDSTFPNSFIQDTNLTTNHKLLGTLNYETTYYWRVLARNISGNSIWSQRWNFKTIPSPPLPVGLNSPLNNSTSVQVLPSLNFTWSQSLTAQSYWMQISTNSGFSTIIANKLYLSINSTSIDNLSNNTNYFWRVKALSDAGESDWSNVWTFATIIGLPPVPTVNLPSNGAIGLDTSLTLQWVSNGEITSYSLEVSADPGFISTIVYEPSYTNSQKLLTSLSYATTYYWRCKSRNSIGESEWVISQFTTKAAHLEPNQWNPATSSTETKAYKINCIVYDNVGNAYAGGDSAVYISKDGGQNWLPVGKNYSYLSYVNSIVVNSTGDVLASAVGGIFRFSNQDSIWRQVYNVLATVSLSINSSSEILGSYGQSVIKSVDNGSNWNIIPNLPLSDQCQDAGIIFTSPNNIIYVGTIKNIDKCSDGLVEVYKSINNGVSWQSTGFNTRDNAFGVTAMTSNILGELIIGTSGSGNNMGGVYKYNGSQWEKLGLSAQKITSIVVTTSGDIYVSSFSSSSGGIIIKRTLRTNSFNGTLENTIVDNAGISKSKDGGKTWESANSGLSDTRISALAVTPSGQLFVGTTQGGIYETKVAIVNKAPYFLSKIRDTTTYKNQTLKIQISAADENFDKLKFTFNNHPSGSTLDSISNNSRILNWSPTKDQIGTFLFGITVSDGKLTDYIQFNVMVSNFNSQPNFISFIIDTTIKENQSLSIVFSADDPDNDILTFSSINIPKTARLDFLNATSRVFNWKPIYGESGVYKDIHIIVSDGILNNTVKFNITVKKDNRPPNVFTLLSPNYNDIIRLMYPEKLVEFRWISSADPDVNDIVNYRLIFQGKNVDTIIYDIKQSVLSLNLMSKLQPDNEYKWYVIASDGFLFTKSNEFTFKTSSSITGINKSIIIPESFGLMQNFPNPFNPSTNIQFGIPKESKISIQIFNVLGQKVCSLIDNEVYQPGIWNIAWDGKNQFGRPVSSGIYFYRLVSKEFIQTLKMIMMK